MAEVSGNWAAVMLRPRRDTERENWVVGQVDTADQHQGGTAGEGGGSDGDHPVVRAVVPVHVGHEPGLSGCRAAAYLHDAQRDLAGRVQLISDDRDAAADVRPWA